jgi:hypothetical protein
VRFVSACLALGIGNRDWDLRARSINFYDTLLACMAVYPASFQTASACGSAQKQPPRRRPQQFSFLNLNLVAPAGRLLIFRS